MKRTKILAFLLLVSVLFTVFSVTSFAEDADVIKPFGERTTEALINLVLGMLVVFAVMTLLYIILALVGKAFSSMDKKGKSKPEKKPEPKPVKAEAAPAPVAPAAGNDEELVAAITAAIALCLTENGEDPSRFRVVSFRRTNAVSAWNKK